jgi:predicted AAA+ superfamily ATPase
MTQDQDLPALKAELARIATALEAMMPSAAPAVTVSGSTADAFVWQCNPDRLVPVETVNRLHIGLLKGIDKVRDTLFANTERFARGLPANNALIWGARGTGKSSVIKAVHAAVAEKLPSPRLILVEIHREDIDTLPRLLGHLKSMQERFILFCDDLSFDHDDTSYKSLKAVLEGGIEGRPENVLFYATSNRRHLMPRDMMDNERASANNPSEAGDEKVSLSDRFGLWVGMHNCSQQDYLDIVDAYADHFGVALDRETLHARAKEWSITRGSRSGRVAWQFIQDILGEQGTR